jgi:hypothetical protein
VNPVTSLPGLFGANSIFGGADGSKWMSTYPYALPNLLCAVLLFVEAIIVVLYLNETLKGFKGIDFRGLSLKSIYQSALEWRRSKGYRRLSIAAFDEDEALDKPRGSSDEKRRGSIGNLSSRLPFTQIWTSNVIWTLLSVAVFDFHMG